MFSFVPNTLVGGNGIYILNILEKMLYCKSPKKNPRSDYYSLVSNVIIMLMPAHVAQV